MLFSRPPIWLHFDWLLDCWIDREIEDHSLIFLIAIDQFISGQARATGASAADLSSPSDHFLSLARAVYSDVVPFKPRMSVLGSRGSFGIRALTRSTPVTVIPAAGCVRSFSVLNRPPPNYPGHIPLTTVERGALAVGSAIGSYLNPRRAGALLLEAYRYTSILIQKSTD